MVVSIFSREYISVIYRVINLFLFLFITNCLISTAKANVIVDNDLKPDNKRDIVIDIVNPYIYFEKYSIDKTIELWQRQLLVLRITMKSDEEFAYFETINKDNNSFLIETTTTNTIEIKDSKLFKKQIILYIWPLTTSNTQLTALKIVLKAGGRTIDLVSLNQLILKIKPLPDYLPPGFPVGHISLSNNNSFTDRVWSTKGEITDYKLTINSSGIHPLLLPNYVNYLASQSITKLTSMERLDKTSLSSEYKLQEINNVTLVNRKLGTNYFNSFKVMYFNPLTEKIESYEFIPDYFLTTNIYIQIIFILLMLLLIWLCVRYFIRNLNVLGMRLSIWRSIYQADGYHAISKAIKQFKPYNGSLSTPANTGATSLQSTDNITLTDWLTQFDANNTLTNCIVKLNKSLYNRNGKSSAHEQLKSEVLTVLRGYESIWVLLGVYMFCKAKRP